MNPDVEKTEGTFKPADPVGMERVAGGTRKPTKVYLFGPFPRIHPKMRGSELKTGSCVTAQVEKVGGGELNVIYWYLRIFLGSLAVTAT